MSVYLESVLKENLIKVENLGMYSDIYSELLEEYLYCDEILSNST